MDTALYVARVIHADLTYTTSDLARGVSSAQQIVVPARSVVTAVGKVPRAEGREGMASVGASGFLLRSQ